MSKNNFVVCYIDRSKYTDFDDKYEFIQWLNCHTNEFVWTHNEYEFDLYENAEAFAKMIYAECKLNNVIAIYNKITKKWICNWFR